MNSEYLQNDVFLKLFSRPICACNTQNRLFWWYLSDKWNFQKILEGVRFFKIQSTIFLQIFCEFISNSKVMFKSIKGPDNSCQGYLKAWKIKVHSKVLNSEPFNQKLYSRCLMSSCFICLLFLKHQFGIVLWLL